MIRNGRIQVRLVPHLLPIAVLFINDDHRPRLHRWVVEAYCPSQRASQFMNSYGTAIRSFDGELTFFGSIDGEASSFPPNFVSVHHEGFPHRPSMLIGDTIDDVVGDDPCYRYDPSFGQYQTVR